MNLNILTSFFPLTYESFPKFQNAIFEISVLTRSRAIKKEAVISCDFAFKNSIENVELRSSLRMIFVRVGELVKMDKETAQGKIQPRNVYYIRLHVHQFNWILIYRAVDYNSLGFNFFLFFLFQLLWNLNNFNAWLVKIFALKFNIYISFSSKDIHGQT